MTPQRALLVRAGALGDILLLRRVVYALRRQGSSVSLLAPAAAGSVLLGPGDSEVDRLIDWDRGDVAALFDAESAVPQPLADELRRFQLAVVCSRNEALAAHLRTLAGAVVTVDPAPPPGVHASHWYCHPLPVLGNDATADPPPLRPTDDERAGVAPWRERLPARFLAVHPGSGSPAKNWPAAGFAGLVHALSPPGGAWLLVEGPADAEAAATLARQPGAVRARELPPRVLGALLADAGLFVGNDSGVTHLAAAFGAPTVALFGPTDPGQWSPVGPAVQVLRAPAGAMDQLDVEIVLVAAQRAASTSAAGLPGG